MSIGGPLDYSKLAQQHRPVSTEGLKAEVLRLHGTGLMAVDISVALRLDLATVREWLGAKAP